jgi:hypothetical protein
MSRLAFEGEHGPLHGQEPLVQAPAIGRVGDENHVGALEMSSFEQRNFAAA